MKQILQIFLAITFLSVPSSAQFTSFGIKTGFETITSNYNQIFFQFVDESPSKDNITSTFDLSQNYNPITISPYLKRVSNKMEYEIEFKLGLESEFRALGTYISAVKQFGNIEKGTLGLGAQLGFGRSKLYLGDIYQNDVFIQINGNKFYDNSLGVNYFEQQLTFKPLVRYSKIFNSKFEFSVNAGYQVPALSFNGKVVFKGEDSNSDSGFFEETVSLNKRNIAFYTDSVQRKKKIFNQQGLFANIGIGILFK